MIAASIAAVLITAMVLGYKVHANKPPKHVHRWWTEGTRVIKIWGNSDNPVAHRTDVSMSCEGCGEKKIEGLDGVWSSNIDELD